MTKPPKPGSKLQSAAKPQEAREEQPSLSDLDERLRAVERLIGIFRTERLVYLFFAAISMALLLVCAGSALYKGTAEVTELTGLFGSTGVIGYTAGRILQMWSQALRMIAGEAIGQ